MISFVEERLQIMSAVTLQLIKKLLLKFLSLLKDVLKQQRSKKGNHLVPKILHVKAAFEGGIRRKARVQ